MAKIRKTTLIQIKVEKANEKNKTGKITETRDQSKLPTDQKRAEYRFGQICEVWEPRLFGLRPGPTASDSSKEETFVKRIDAFLTGTRKKRQ